MKKIKLFKTIIALTILLILGPVFYFRLTKPNKSSAAWFNDGWSYRKSVQISNGSGSNLTDFQVNIGIGTSVLISQGKMKTDCSDIRITDTNGKLLNHWLEGPCNNVSNATIWTKVPSLPTSGGVVYVYYGNPSATNTSSTTKTFIREISNVVGAWTFNEGVGTTARDYSGNNYLATMGLGSSAPAWTSGMFGIGLSFVGNNYISSTVNKPSSMPISFSFWIKPQNSIAANAFFDTAPNTGNVLRIYGNKLSWWWNGSGNESPSISLGITGDNNWYHVVGIYSYNGSRRIDYYRNGILIDGQNGASDINFAWTTFVMGMFNYNGGDRQSYYGIVDEPRIYNRALTQAEITDIYGSGGNNVGYVTTNYPGKELIRKYSATAPTSSLSSTEETSKAPIAYWSFDDPTSPPTGGSAGQAVRDSTSNHNDGTLGAGTSAPTWQTEDMCISGKCLKFDGVNDYVYRISTDSLRISTDLSLGAWVYLNSTGIEQTIFGKWDESNNTRSYRLWISSTNKLNMSLSSDGTSGNTYTVTGSTSLSANKWYYLQGVADIGTNMKLYIDGKQDGSDISGNPSAISANQSELDMGTKKNSSGNLDTFLNGRVDEVKIYPYARSAGEILTDFNNRSSQKGSSVQIGSKSVGINNGLVGYWKMDESSWNGSAGEVVDSSGNANHGTGVGTTKPTTGAGKFGNGGVFDGINQNVNTNSDLPFRFADTTFSVAGWFKTGQTTTGYLIAKDAVVGGWGIWVNHIGENQLGVMLKNAAGGNAATRSSSTNINDNVWHHFVAVITTNTSTAAGNDITIYIDGSLNQGSIIKSYAFTTPTDNLTFGKRSSGSYYTGSLDEVRIYNRALQPSEVKQLYEYAPGPVAYYNFNEGVGSSAYDTSGNSNNGLWSGTGTHWGTGKVGKAGKFNGNDDYILAGSAPSVNITKAVTMEAWVKTSSSADQWIISKFLSSSGENGYELEFFSGVVYVAIRDSAGTGVRFANSTFALGDGKWHYLVGTYDGNTIILYIDGLKRNSYSSVGSIGVANSSLVIGARGPSGSEFRFNGLIDEVKIYNYARTQKQIVEDMLGSPKPAVGGEGGRAGAIAQYKFDEGYGTTTKNFGFGGANLNGTFGTGVSAPTWTENGKYGKALSFDGAFDRVGVGATISTQTASKSVFAWVNPTSGTNYTTKFGRIFNHDFTGNQWVLAMCTNGRVGGTPNGNTNYGCTTKNNAVVTNTWNHVGWTYDGTNFLVYINGVAQATNTVDNTFVFSDAGNVLIGFRSSQEFNGLIDEVKVYNFALTQDEIRTDFNNGSALIMGSLSSGVGNTASSTAQSQEYCIPGDTAICSPPVGRWDFNEGVGTSAYDTSGNGNNGYFGAGNLAPSWSSGKIGKGLRFDGINDYVRNTSNLISSGNFTYTVWFNTNSVSVSQNIIGLRGTEAAGTYIGTRIVGSKLVTYVDGGNALTGTSTLSNNTWYFLSVTYDSTANPKTIVSLNNNIEGTQNNSANYTWDQTLIGARTTSTMIFSGIIDQVKIYNYARTPAQIAWDYNEGKPSLYFDFDECQGTVVKDLISVGVTASISIGPSGSQTSQGTCSIGIGSTVAWGNGSSGKYNASLNFDGTDDLVTYAGGTSNQTGNDTISAWIYPISFANYNIIIDSQTTANTENNQYNLYLDSSGKVSRWGASGCTSDKVLSLSTWSHVLSTYDGTYIKIYINGLLDKNCQIAKPSVTSTVIRIGARSSSSFPFSGKIDDVKLWNYPLTATQIKTLYNQNAAVRFGPESGNP